MDISKAGSQDSLAVWQNAIQGIEIAENSNARKAKTLSVIDQLGVAIEAGMDPSQAGAIVDRLLSTVKPLSFDYSDLIQRINEKVSLYKPDDRTSYHLSGWTMKEGELHIRADELSNKDFWPMLDQHLKGGSLKGVTIQGSEGDLHVSAVIAQQLIKEAPNPSCFQQSIHCQLLDSTKEIPEFLLRGAFPALSAALNGSFVREGQSTEQPLHLSINLEQLSILEKYLGTVSQPHLTELPAAEAALLYELVDYGGSESLIKGLNDRLDSRLGVTRSDLKFEQNNARYSPENSLWFGEFYANTQLPHARERLDDYFGTALSNLVFKWKAQSAPPKQRFLSKKALDSGEVQSARLQPKKELPPPESFESILDVLRQISLTRLVIKADGPQWFWDGIKTLDSVPEVAFSKGRTTLSEHGMNTLRAMQPQPKLLFAKEEDLEKARQNFPGFQLGLS